MGEFTIYQAGKDCTDQKFIELLDDGTYKKSNRNVKKESGKWRRVNNSIILTETEEYPNEGDEKGTEVCRLENKDKKLIDGDGGVYIKVE
jgi:hypothetical protein